MSAPVLHATDLHVIRNGVDILALEQLDISAGEHWAILGPNGAGKSTLLKVLGTREFPSRGHVDILGETLGRTDVFALRRRIGYVDPKQRLGDIDCTEAVMSGITASNGLIPRWEPSKRDLQVTGQSIELVGMQTRAHHRWMRMSQGEKARTLIARALVTEPELLLLDEPSTGLDLPGRERILTTLDLLRQSQKRLASVTITHHVEEIAASTTHALLIKDGGVLAAGEISETLNSRNLSELYDMDVDLHNYRGRWMSFAADGPR